MIYIIRSGVYLSDSVVDPVLSQICVNRHNRQTVLERTDCRYHPFSACVCIKHHLWHKGYMACGALKAVESSKHLVFWCQAQFPKTLSETLSLNGNIGVRLPGVFAQVKLCEDFPTFLFLLKLPKNLSGTQAFPIRVDLA